MANVATASLGAQFRVLWFGEWKTIANITGIDASGINTETIEKTSLASNGFKEYMGGWSDGGDISLDLLFYEEFFKSFYEYVIKTKSAFTYAVIFPDKYGFTFQFVGVITNLSFGASVGEAIKASMSLKVTGLPTLGNTDIVAPTLSLIGSSYVEITEGDTYTDAGAIATDNFDNDLTASIVVNNPVNPAVVGTYTITYDVTDSSGNVAQQISRTVAVKVNASAPPVVQSLREDNITNTSVDVVLNLVDKKGTISSIGYEYKRLINGGGGSGSTGGNAALGEHSFAISLLIGEPYKWRAFAVNENGTSYGQWRNFHATGTIPTTMDSVYYRPYYAPNDIVAKPVYTNETSVVIAGISNTSNWELKDGSENIITINSIVAYYNQFDPTWLEGYKIATNALSPGTYTLTLKSVTNGDGTVTAACSKTFTVS